MARVVVRMCVGCRGRAPDKELVRFVAAAPIRGPVSKVAPTVPLAVDPPRSAPGRGAWIHPDGACLDLAVRRRTIGRALKIQGSVDYSALERYVEALAHSPDELAQIVLVGNAPIKAESEKNSHGEPMKLHP